MSISYQRGGVSCRRELDAWQVGANGTQMSQSARAASMQVKIVARVVAAHVDRKRHSMIRNRHFANPGEAGLWVDTHRGAVRHSWVAHHCALCRLSKSVGDESSVPNVVDTISPVRQQLCR